MAPDVDAVSSVWLLKRFLPGWESADVAFVPAGKTLGNEPVDSDPDILHVDTGMGILDHHQTGEDTCAAKRTMEYISQVLKPKAKSQRPKDKIHKEFPDEAMERLVDVVNIIDHFKEVYFPNPTADFYDFGLVGIMDGWKLIYSDDHLRIISHAMEALDGIYKAMQNKVWAEREIKENGVEFQSKWGKGIGIETINDETIRIAQKSGYVIAVRKDPKKGYVRIKSLPDPRVDLTDCYNRYKEIDKEATWFLHAGKNMVLNGSMKNPQTKATKLTLREIIEVLKSKSK